MTNVINLEEINMPTRTSRGIVAERR